MLAVSVAAEVSDLIATVEEYKSIAEKLAHYRAHHLTEGTRPLLRTPPTLNKFNKLIYWLSGGEKVDAIEAYQEMKKQAKQRVERLRVTVRERRATGVVFVTFTSSHYAKVSYLFFFPPLPSILTIGP